MKKELRSRIALIIKVLVVAAALFVVGLELVRFDNYALFIDSVAYFSASKWALLLLILLLMPLNMLFEALKWRAAVSGVEQITVATAFKATLVGMVGAIATPNRLGDFPLRVVFLKKESRASAIILGFISSWALVAVITIAGLIGGVVHFRSGEDNKLLLVALALVVLIILAITAIPPFSKHLSGKLTSQRWQRIAAQLGTLNGSQTIQLFAFSAVRYIIFCVQFYLALTVCSVEISAIEALSAIPLIYLFATITPVLEIAAPLVRMTWSLLFLSTANTNTPAIAMAVMLIWLINTLIPMLCGLPYSKKIEL